MNWNPLRKTSCIAFHVVHLFDNCRYPILCHRGRREGPNSTSTDRSGSWETPTRIVLGLVARTQVLMTAGGPV
jgi:hypothetical protein